MLSIRIDVPHFQDQLKKFKRTDSSESSNSSLASFGGISAILGRHNNAAKKKLASQTPHPHPHHPPVFRTDSNTVSISRGYVVHEDNGLARSPEQSRPERSAAAGASVVTVSGPNTTTSSTELGATVTVSTNASRSDNEVAIIVGGRRDSTTTAVR